jgi:hypothetical protein
MIMTLQYWFMFPVAILITTTAMASPIPQNTLERGLGVLFILIVPLLWEKPFYKKFFC